MIEEGIKTVLAPLVPDKVYEIDTYNKADIGGYPRIVILLSNTTSETITNKEVLHRHDYTVALHQQASEDHGGAVQAQEQVNQISREILSLLSNEIRADAPLNGTCQWVESVNTEEQSQVQQLPMVSNTFTITAVTIQAV